MSQPMYNRYSDFAQLWSTGEASHILDTRLDDDQRRQGYPWKFYRLTEEGQEFLEDHNLLAAEETLQQIYDTIADKSEKMVKYENAPRPDDV